MGVGKEVSGGKVLRGFLIVSVSNLNMSVGNCMFLVATL